MVCPICNRADHYIFTLWFLLSFFLSFPRLISAVGDWMSAILPSTHGVALVANLGRRSKTYCMRLAEMQDAQNRQKIAICAPSYNFVGLYLRN